MPLITNLLFKNRNSFSGFGLSPTKTCFCLNGEAVKNNDGSCGCKNSDGVIIKSEKSCPNGQIIYTWQDCPVIISPNDTIITMTPKTDTPTTQESVTIWIKDNPLVFAGGLAGLGLLGFLLLKDK